VRTAFVLVALCAFSLGAHAQNEEQRGPKQPVEFNHKLHAGQLKQPCQLCHAPSEGGEMVDMPEVSKCMQCHSAIAPRSKAEGKLAAFAKQDRDVDWTRVYQIPTFVRFSHSQHAQAGVKCESCHGPVAQRVTLWQEHDVSMGSCMNCHRQMHASLDCGSCHEPR
jgi:Class III cytochrome C family/Cytochrome c7 and related cytochrome c